MERTLDAIKIGNKMEEKRQRFVGALPKSLNNFNNTSKQILEWQDPQKNGVKQFFSPRQYRSAGKVCYNWVIVD